MKRKDLIKLLAAAGYKLVRTGDHAIYEKEGGRSVQVPNTAKSTKILPAPS